MTFEVNNHGIIALEQLEHDCTVHVERFTAHGNGDKEWDYEYRVESGDFVMLLNYYRQQKSHGLPIL